MEQDNRKIEDIILFELENISSKFNNLHAKLDNDDLNHEDLNEIVGDIRTLQQHIQDTKF